MTSKQLYILLLLLVAAVGVYGQGADIPVEKDNNYPLENPEDPKSLGDEPQGSGDGTLDQPFIDESTPVPQLEEVQPSILAEVVNTDTTEGSQLICPEPCVCHFKEDEHYVVDCGGYQLQDFPAPLDSKTATLILKNNKLTSIPKDVSALKNLQVLNAENNQIMELAAGSISELPELTTLKLANNRLIEFPQDLKNAFTLTKLQEIDLGGNDMRDELKAETFSSFKSLQKLILAQSSSDLVENVCTILKDSLKYICTETCENQQFDCPNAPEEMDAGMMQAVLPGTMMDNLPDEPNDPVIKTNTIDDTATETVPSVATEDPSASKINKETSGASENGASPNEAGSRAAVNKEAIIAIQNGLVEDAPKEVEKTDSDVKVGATKTEANTGGVDKSVIGLVVAGMVVIVAGITIKKNWTSIKKRFSSSSRTPNERGGANANGTAAPEEVPLQDKQDKSPV